METPYIANAYEELGQQGDACQTEEVADENKSLIWSLMKQVCCYFACSLLIVALISTSAAVFFPLGAALTTITLHVIDLLCDMAMSQINENMCGRDCNIKHGSHPLLLLSLMLINYSPLQPRFLGGSCIEHLSLPVERMIILSVKDSAGVSQLFITLQLFCSFCMVIEQL